MLRSRRRRTQLGALVLSAAALLAPTLAAGPASAEQDVAGAPGVIVPTLDWTWCGGGLQCATAQVPLDYDVPSGPKIGIALIRSRATDPSHRIGSLFVNPGGPGGSGVDFVRADAASLWSSQVRARFDIVGFDPRGIGRSAPVQCFGSNDAENTFLSGTPAFPVGRQQQVDYISTYSRFAARCLQDNASIMQHMSTADAARDLDVLRAAVGDRALTYDGVSYGSYLGNTYANLFPQRVRALVIDGVLDPVAWATGRGNGDATPFSLRLGSATGAADTLQEFFRLCAAGGPRCEFAAGGDPAAKYAALLDRARRTPIVVQSGGQQVRLTYADIVNTVLGALYDPSSWPALAQSLQVIDQAAEPGAGAPAAAVSLSLSPYQNSAEAFLGVACTDTDNPRDPFRWPTAVAPLDPQTAGFASAWGYASLPCALWPTRAADRYPGPFTRRTSSPVLVVGNLHDPATPYWGARSAASMLPSSRLLTLDGWGHTSLGKSSCVDARISAYLVGQQLPPAGTVCRPDDVPFQAAASTVSAVPRAALDLVTAVNRPR